MSRKARVAIADPQTEVFISIASAWETKLPPHHGDPFDRMLVAQSLRGDFTLVSKDRVVSAYGARTLW